MPLVICLTLHDSRDVAENREGLHHRIALPALVLRVREVDACQNSLCRVYKVMKRRREVGGGRTHLDEDEDLISWFLDLLDLVANVIMSAHLVIDLHYGTRCQRIHVVPERLTGFSPARSFMSENLEKVGQQARASRLWSTRTLPRLIWSQAKAYMVKCTEAQVL